MGAPARDAQRALFCACGRVDLHARSLCRYCYQYQANSRRRFGGERDRVLERDHRHCRACGALPARPHVHHRRPGCQDRRWLVALCPRCHFRVHKLGRLRGWAPETLVVLWAEQHPGSPLQLQFGFGG